MKINLFVNNNQTFQNVPLKKSKISLYRTFSFTTGTNIIELIIDGIRGIPVKLNEIYLLTSNISLRYRYAISISIKRYWIAQFLSNI